MLVAGAAAVICTCAASVMDGLLETLAVAEIPKFGSRKIDDVAACASAPRFAGNVIVLPAMICAAAATPTCAAIEADASNDDGGDGVGDGDGDFDFDLEDRVTATSLGTATFSPRSNDAKPALGPARLGLAARVSWLYRVTSALKESKVVSTPPWRTLSTPEAIALRSASSSTAVAVIAIKSQSKNL
jgi:hypothetical protein